MFDSIDHDGFTEFNVSPKLQADLAAADTVLQADGPSISAQLKVIPDTQATLYEYPKDPRNPERQKAAEQFAKVLKPIIINWPGKPDPRLGWQSKGQFTDVMLQKGVLVTPTSTRNVYIPRPLPQSQSQAGDVLIMNRKSKSQELVRWDSSKAYMLEAGVCIAAQNNESIRMWLLGFRCEEEKKDEEAQNTDGRRSVERDDGS